MEDGISGTLVLLGGLSKLFSKCLKLSLERATQLALTGVLLHVVRIRTLGSKTILATSLSGNSDTCQGNWSAERTDDDTIGRNQNPKGLTSFGDPIGTMASKTWLSN